MNKHTLPIISFITLSAVSALADDTNTIAAETWMDADGAIWKLSADQFMTEHRSHGFTWVSSKRDAARSADARLRFAGVRVWEAIIRFDNDNLKQISLSLYNRGDAGDLSQYEFEKLLASVNKALDGWAGSKAIVFKEQSRAAAVAIERKAWVKDPHRLDLFWSITAASRQHETMSARPEYIRLDLAPFDSTHDPRKEVIASGLTTQKLLTTLDMKTRVKRDTDGDVMITGISMVDQGQKGYCAAAVAERVLRYYGKNFDEHEVAQIANTSSGGGTNPEAMIAALRRIANQLSVEVKVINDFDYPEFKSLIREYNSLAKKAGNEQIHYDETGVIKLTDIYKELDADLLKQVRLKRKTPMDQFKAQITKYINSGVPVVWSVMVGKIEETPAIRGMGGHMRLIIGYNERTSEILYTDTWGAGHEKKRMLLNNAWTMTLGTYAIYPKGMLF